MKTNRENYPIQHYLLHPELYFTKVFINKDRKLSGKIHSLFQGKKKNSKILTLFKISIHLFTNNTLGTPLGTFNKYI